MIRKLTRLAGSPERTMALFQDVEAWPEWMPGMRSLRVVERTSSRVIADVEQVQMGRRLRQTITCSLSENALELEQVAGPFRRWWTAWRFTPAPGGHGTTVSMELDLQMGGMGMMVPRRLVQAAVDELFRMTVAAAKVRLARPQADLAVGEVAARTLAAIRSGENLVLELAGRRYRLVRLKDGRRDGP